MNMVRLIYVSRMTEECDTKALEDILKVSRKKNQARGITGALCYDPNFFMQCLEGPREAVNDLYADIVKDKRHTDVTLLEYGEVHHREFEQWSMAYVPASDVDKKTLLKYSTGRRFDPYTMSADQARAFLIEIVWKHAELLAERMAKKVG